MKKRFKKKLRFLAVPMPEVSHPSFCCSLSLSLLLFWQLFRDLSSTKMCLLNFCSRKAGKRGRKQGGEELGWEGRSFFWPTTIVVSLLLPRELLATQVYSPEQYCTALHCTALHCFVLSLYLDERRGVQGNTSMRLRPNAGIFLYSPTRVKVQTLSNL